MIRIYVTLCSAMVCLLTVHSNAAIFSSAPQTILTQGDTLTGDFWVGAETVNINGSILGDLIAGSREISVSGAIDQDVFAMGQRLKIDGSIGDDVTGLFSEISVKGRVEGGIRVVAKVVFIEGHIVGDVFALASEVIIAENAVVNGELHLTTSSLWINGLVNGKVVANVDDASITGTVKNDVRISVGKKLDLFESAIIEGTLTYKADKELDNIKQDIAQGGVVYEQSKTKLWFSSLRVTILLWALVAALIVGMILIGVWRKGFEDTTSMILQEPLKSFASGFVFVILVPIVAVTSMIILVTIPGALIVLTLYAIILYLAKIFAGNMLGHFIFNSTGRDDASPLAKMTLGVVIVYVLINIPYFGDLLALGFVIIGAGALVRVIMKNMGMRSVKAEVNT
jgi:hypothetical protein